MSYTYRHNIQMNIDAYRYPELREAQREMGVRSMMQIFANDGLVPVGPVRECETQFYRASRMNEFIWMPATEGDADFAVVTLEKDYVPIFV